MLFGNRNQSQKKRKIKYLCIIQARLGSTRFPGKVLQTINGRTLIKRVWDAAKGSKADKVVVAWPERYPDLDQNDVRERFRRVSKEFPSDYIIRLTSDCPLLTSQVLNESIDRFDKGDLTYYSNRDKYQDGFDVQIFTTFMLHRDYATHKEHVILPHKHPTPDKFLSVDTPDDLKRARYYARFELNGKPTDVR